MESSPNYSNYERYDFLRNEAPVHWNGRSWLISKYDDVKSCLIDKRLTAARSDLFFPPNLETKEVQKLRHFLKSWVFFTDIGEGPIHREYIKSVTNAQAIQELQESLIVRLDEIMSGLKKKQQINWIADLAVPVRVHMLSFFFKISEAQAALIIKPGDDLFDFVKASKPTHELTEKAARSLDVLHEILRSNPGVIEQFSQIAMASKLSEIMFSNTIMTLTEHPSDWKKLAADHSLIPYAVQECLRLESPTQFISRVTLQKITLRQTEIEEGAWLSLMLGSANRDPLMFSDPDQFDMSRNPNPHLAFGFGGKRCANSYMTPNILRLIVEKLVNVFPNAPIKVIEKTWFHSLEARRLHSFVTTVKGE